MTHGFDDQGRKFDAHGNLRDWWTPEDLKNYIERAKCVEDQFDGVRRTTGSTSTASSPSARTSPTSAASRSRTAPTRPRSRGKPAPAPIDGFTADQRFFLAWARVWAANIRPEQSKLLVNTNPHPLSQFRAIGPPSNLPEFAKAFGCKPGDAMVRKESVSDLVGI